LVFDSVKLRARIAKKSPAIRISLSARIHSRYRTSQKANWPKKTAFAKAVVISPFREAMTARKTMLMPSDAPAMAAISRGEMLLIPVAQATRLRACVSA